MGLTDVELLEPLHRDFDWDGNGGGSKGVVSCHGSCILTVIEPADVCVCIYACMCINIYD